MVWTTMKTVGLIVMIQIVQGIRVVNKRLF
jgi:hypothetical protein